jgi:2-iminobutanoate/2-iminopropanoate deaminase
MIHAPGDSIFRRMNFMKSPAFLWCVVVIIAGCMPAKEHSMSDRKPEFLNSPEAAARNWPFSQAVRAGDFLFLAGQIGTDASGKVVAGGIVPESRQMLENIKAVLEENGASLRDVVKCTVFLADMAEWSTFNGVYTQFFTKPYPARSAFGANGLALNSRVEVECIAFVPQKRS